MKQLKLIITSSLTMAMLSACGTSTVVAPSQNSALNSITDSNGKEKSGYMQQGLDSWLKDDWTPTMEQNEEIRTKYMDKVEPKSSKAMSKDEATVEGQEETTEVKYVEKKDKNFTLQEYVDKSAAYFEVQERDLEGSNVKKMQSMPVIGK